jgi:dipeptidyl aminopeptidase/acylaminoacyl peptidase
LFAVRVLLSFCCSIAVAQNPAFQLFRKPCVDTRVLADLTSHYPVPVSVSPDGKLILLRTANPTPKPFGLAVVDQASGTTVRALAWPQPILRLQWRPDGSEILFFSMRGLTEGRDLFVWNLGQDAVRHIVTPETSAEPEVRWAPNGLRVAFSNAGESLVIVHTSGDDPPLALDERIVEFDWLADSNTIALVDNEHPNMLQLIDISTGITRTQSFSTEISILDIAAAPSGDSLLLLESTTSKVWRLERFDAETGKSSTLLRSPYRLASPTWLSDGRGFCFQRFKKSSGEIMSSADGSHRLKRLPNLGGVNDIRGTVPGDNAVVVAHSSDAPVALYSLSTSGVAKRIYASHSDRLPSVKAVAAFSRSKSGSRVALFVWRGMPRQSLPMAVIRVRGGLDTLQLPIWEEHIQVFTKRGIYVIAVNHGTNKNSEQQRREDVVAAVRYANSTLKVPLDRIILLGHSSGADLVAATCATAPGSCAKMVLVSLGKVKVEGGLPLSESSPAPRLIVFYPAYDFTPRYAVVQNLRKAFGPAIFQAPHSSLFQFPDDHNLMYPSSWAAVYSAILAEFRLGSCADTSASEENSTVDSAR